MFSLLKIPIISIMCIYLMCGSGCIGFIDTTLAIFLDKQVKEQVRMYDRLGRELTGAAASVRADTSFSLTRWQHSTFLRDNIVSL